MDYREFNFKSCTGDELFACSWEVDDKAKANFLIIHGLGEHCGRYREFAEFLVNQGHSVYAYDYHGFGKSPGQRGHIHSFDVYFQDMYRLIQIFQDPWQKKKTVLLGHSLGGLLGLAYGIKFPDTVDALVITSPWLKNYPLPKYLALAATVCNKIAPRLSLNNGLKVAKICRKQDVVEKYVADPLVHGKITPKFYYEAKKTIEYTLQNSRKLRNPLLLLHAGADEIVDPSGVQEFAADLSPELKKEIVCYAEMYHEILNENGKEEVWQKIVKWVQEL